MIYKCFYCGSRIAERTKNSDMEIIHVDIAPEDVGKHLLHDHKAFCSGYCIESYQNASRYIKERSWEERHPNQTADWYESDWRDDRRNKKPRPKARVC